MNDTGTRPTRLCLLGCGRAAAMHAATLRHLGGTRCSFASRSLDKAQAFNAKHAGAGAFGSYEAAILSADIDAVAVLTPPSSHLELTLRALEAGKDVILEKPPVLRSSDFDAIEASCRHTGRLVFVAENYFYKPMVKAIRDLLASGAVGEPLFVHLNAVKRQNTTGDWRDDPHAAGGGTLFEGGIHWVNFAGNIGYEIESVAAVRPGTAAPLDRSLALLIRYRQGPACMLSCSWEVASRLKGIRLSRVYGREGGILFESNGLFLLAYGRRFSVRMPGLADLQGYKGMFADFLRAWRERTEPGMTLARARRDLEVVEEAYRSARVASASSAQAPAR